MVQTYFGNTGWVGRVAMGQQDGTVVKVPADKLSNPNPSLELMQLGKPDDVSLIPRTHVKVEGES